MTPRCYRPDAGGLLVSVRVTPNAGADRIDGPQVRDDGNAVLRVRVRAVPEGGKANTAVIALVSRALGVPRSSIALVSGDTARLKVLRLDGDPGALAAAIDALGPS